MQMRISTVGKSTKSRPNGT